MSNQGNGGRYSKFQERLRNIRLSRSKREQFFKENEVYVQEKLQEIRDVIGKESVRVVRRVRAGVKEEVPNSISKKKETEEMGIGSTEKVDSKLIVCDLDEKSLSKGQIIDKVPNNLVGKRGEQQQTENAKEIVSMVEEIREKKPKLSSAKKGYFYQDRIKKEEEVKNYSEEERKEQLTILGTEILSRMKGQFEDHLDDLEVLMSELYFLEKSQENEIELKKVKETKKEILQLIQRVNEIVEQYNLYKKNCYIDHVVGIDDNALVEDMISYRTLLDNASMEKGFVRQYKALDEFKSLYEKLEVIRTKTATLKEKNEEKIEKFDIRDKKYNQVKLGLIRVNDVVKSCNEEMGRQNQYFDQLMNKINKINQEEYTTYRLKGIQDLIGQSLRYLGFLMLSPLSGLLPGIAVQTMATKKMIGNVYRNLHFEEVRHVRYRAIDYDSELSHKLTDINYTSNMIDDTLRDIDRLKDDFMLQYDSRIPGYEDTLKKIDKIYHNVVRSQNRVEKIRQRLKKSKKLNEEKFVRVRELNEKDSSF